MPACFPACGGACLRRTACGRWPRARPVIVLHQGTVWPWLMGAYGEAVLRAAWDVPGSVRELLRTIRPLFAQHLGDAGIGSVSEIFDGDPPHLPNGCIAQAWSVAECLRLLHLLKEAAPGVYAEWEANARKGGN